MTNLTRRLIGLIFQQRNGTIPEMRHGVLNFPFFSMQLKHADYSFSNIYELLLNATDILIRLVKPTGIYIRLEVYTKNEATGILQHSPDLEDNDDPIS